MLEDIQSDDPFVRSRAVQSLASLSPLMQDLAQSKKTVYYTAGKFKSLQDACAILEVTHKTHEHIWDRQDIDDVHSVTLSPDVDSVIQRLHHSEYHNRQLGILHVDLLVGKKHITSHADWLLCHDDPRYSIDSKLVAIEAKRSYEFSNADCQLATYLTAIQASRAKISKVHAIAFGIMTDANRFRFWFVDSERRLFSSPTFDWRVQKAKIITWIDKMLAEAVEASRNVSPSNWEKDFRQRQLLSFEPDGSPSTEGVPFDIIAPDSSHIVGTAWYRGRRVVVVE
ncbi:hypothetical protein N7516_003805 [Penicillium verrucosum]|uniref:uncharacterized protein n=1 Tax=Penicillium verrucosum TaxID=60171 RepID=UPI002544EE4E|nr:uncharacterized protein N7516_003805 [Penicillium verrucosum]KAJ5943637.1 hypothetical protein N7516_003805 [Penicillium verrucosum]